MATNLYSFYNQLSNNLAPNSSSLAGIIIAVSFLEAIAIFFLLIVLLKQAGADDKSSETNANLKSEKSDKN